MILPKLINRNPKIKNFNTLSSFARQFRANVEARGGTIDPGVLNIWDKYFFKPAIAAGNIFNQLDRLCLYAGMGNETAALTNVISNNYHATKVSAPLWDNARGYASAGTSYLRLNYNPRTNGVFYTQNSSIMMCGIVSPNFASTKFQIGCENTGQTFISRIRRTNVGLQTYLNRDSSTSSSTTASGAISGKAFLGVRRTGANAEFNIINATQTAGSTSASNLPPNFEAYELTYNINNAPGGNYDDFYHLFSLHGSKDFDFVTFRTLLLNTYTQLGI